MKLLLFALCTAFVSGLRRTDRVPVRPIPLVCICVVIAIAYMSQRVI